MEIEKSIAENTVTLLLRGRLDTLTSNMLAQELGLIFAGEPMNLVFDFTHLEYISSAGLRVLLTAQKKATAQSTLLSINGANETVREIFDITGFSGIIKIS